jgi:hypothetical protein
LFNKAWTTETIKLWGPITYGVSKKFGQNWKISTLGRCDRLLIAILAPKLNSNGVSTSSKIFTRIVLEKNLLCRCCNSDALISYCDRGVSFGDKIFVVSSKSLSPKGFLV